MKLHANARTCPNSRRLLVTRIEEEGWSLTKAAAAAGVSERSARKWVARWRAEGPRGLVDRSSAPKRIPHRTAPATVDLIARLRRLQMTAAEIAEALELALSTVSVWLRRLGLGKRSRLSPPEPPNRYERARPGELVHVDVKRLGRFKVAGKRLVGRGNASRGYGWEHCHVMVDDATRLAYVEVLADERGETAVTFLRRGVAWFAERGVRVERVMTDNGSPYVSTVHAIACRRARPQAPEDAPLPAADQRQGRALHPDPAARVGLRAPLPQLRGAALPAPALAQPIQLPPKAWLPRPSPTGSSLKRADREQPGYELQLDRARPIPMLRR